MVSLKYVGTHLESSVRDAIRSRCLAWINPYKRSAHICPGYYRWAGVLGLLYRELLSKRAQKIIWERCRHYLSTAAFPFVVSDGSQSSPHVSGVGALVVRLHFVPVLFLCTANSSLEHVPGLPVLLQITSVVGVGLCFKFGMDFFINPSDSRMSIQHSSV